MQKGIWTIRSRFFECTARQRSQIWHQAREYRITASQTAALTGRCTAFRTQEEAIEKVINRGLPTPMNDAMRLGVEMEPCIRDWYAEKVGVKIREPSLCRLMSNFDFRLTWVQDSPLLSEIYGSQDENLMHPYNFIGGSPDGIIEDFNQCVEIKYTKRMYYTLKIHQRDGSLNTGHSHIFPSHYYQMQVCMAITGTSSCAYIVGSPGGNYVEVIRFDQHDWETELLPDMVKVITTRIIPNMTLSDIFRFKHTTVV